MCIRFMVSFRRHLNQQVGIAGNCEWPMPGPRPPAIALSAKLRAILEGFARRPSSPQQLVERSRLILAMADGANNERVARRLGPGRLTARTWRGRWLAAAPRLAAPEAAGEDGT